MNSLYFSVMFTGYCKFLLLVFNTFQRLCSTAAGYQLFSYFLCYSTHSIWNLWCSETTSVEQSSYQPPNRSLFLQKELKSFLFGLSFCLWNREYRLCL